MWILRIELSQKICIIINVNKRKYTAKERTMKKMTKNKSYSVKDWFANKIANEIITIQSLKKHNKNQFAFIKQRIIHFGEIIDIIREGDLIRFSQEKVKRGSQIEADFLLYKDKQKYLLHLFLVKENCTDIYTPRSFFVIGETDNKNTYITSNRPI